MESIRQRAVLTAVLLDSLARHKDGLQIPDVYETIDSAFTFPEEWYRQLPESVVYEELRDLGYPDWRTIPQERLVELVRTEPQWKNEIRWRAMISENSVIWTCPPHAVLGDCRPLE